MRPTLSRVYPVVCSTSSETPVWLFLQCMWHCRSCDRSRQGIRLKLSAARFTRAFTFVPLCYLPINNTPSQWSIIHLPVLYRTNMMVHYSHGIAAKKNKQKKQSLHTYVILPENFTEYCTVDTVDVANKVWCEQTSISVSCRTCGV